MIDAEGLRCQIRSAFPSQQFFGPVTNGCDCDECTELAKDLHHRSWDNIDDKTLDAQFGSLPLLTDEAFAPFLPAWLIRSLANLDDEEQKVREWTLYTLAVFYDDEYDDPDQLSTTINRLRVRLGSLTPEQANAVKEWLLFIRNHACISDWACESINRALCVFDED